MADDEDYGVATTLSGANEEILSGGEGFSRWKKKRSELETLAAQYEDALRERSQSPYADNTGGRLGQAIWAKNKLEESAPPRYSAVYDDEAKASFAPPSPNAPTSPTSDDYTYEPKGEAAYPNTGKGQFQPPPEQLGQPFNLSDAGRVPQGEVAATPGAGGKYPQIEVNPDTHPSVARILANDPAYQLLGPLGKKKYEYLAQHAANIRKSNLPVEKQVTAMLDISRQQSEIAHVHEEGEQAGKAKTIATIAGQQAQQVAQATPIYSERQKQQISQLQEAEQRYRSMAASGNISQEAMQQGLQDVQQQMQTIKPIGSQGPQKDPRFAPNQQQGQDWIDDKTGKHMTRDEKGNLVELKNERTLSTLGQLPSHEAHNLIEAIKKANGLTTSEAVDHIIATEAKVRGDKLTPQQEAMLNKPPHGKVGAKPGPGEAPMPEEKYHASLSKALSHLEKVWEADQKPAEEAHGTSPGKKGGAHEYDKIDKDEWRHAELVKMGLATDGGRPSDIGYKQYMDNWNARHGQKQPGQPEQVGAPATAPTSPAQEFVEKTIPQAIAKAKTGTPGKPYNDSKYFYADRILKPFQEVLQKKGTVLNMTPEERGIYVRGMQMMRKLDPSIPEMTPEYIKKIDAKMPPPDPFIDFMKE